MRSISSITLALLATFLWEASSQAALDFGRLNLPTRLKLKPSALAESLPASLDSDWIPPSQEPLVLSRELAVGRPRFGQLLETMERLSDLTYVPYVWGGQTLGEVSDCTACRECIEAKLKQRRISVERRHRGCAACQRCGVDCSHFVNIIYREADLELPYLTTGQLRRASAKQLREQFSLIDVGRELSQVLPGDLLVTRRHVVMLLRMRSETRGDLLHVSRIVDKSANHRVGSVEVLYNQDIGRFRGRLLRTLRHQLIHQEFELGSELLGALP